MPFEETSTTEVAGDPTSFTSSFGVSPEMYLTNLMEGTLTEEPEVSETPTMTDNQSHWSESWSVDPSAMKVLKDSNLQKRRNEMEKNLAEARAELTEAQGTLSSILSKRDVPRWNEVEIQNDMGEATKILEAVRDILVEERTNIDLARRNGNEVLLSDAEWEVSRINANMKMVKHLLNGVERNLRENTHNSKPAPRPAEEPSIPRVSRTLTREGTNAAEPRRKLSLYRQFVVPNALSPRRSSSVPAPKPESMP